LVRRLALLRFVHAGRVGSFEGLEGATLLRFVHAGRVGSFEGLEGATLFRFGHVGRVGGFEGLKNIKDVKVRRYESVKVVGSGPKVCQKIGIVTGGFGDLDQVVKAGLDTLITGEADYPTEVKARELGINLILGGHRETEVFGVRELAALIRLKM
jgi:putative NIF3 family GTP cyclohydrolase 1 type 2